MLRQKEEVRREMRIEGIFSFLPGLGLVSFSLLSLNIERFVVVIILIRCLDRRKRDRDRSREKP